MIINDFVAIGVYLLILVFFVQAVLENGVKITKETALYLEEFTMHESCYRVAVLKQAGGVAVYKNAEEICWNKGDS